MQLLRRDLAMHLASRRCHSGGPSGCTLAADPVRLIFPPDPELTETVGENFSGGRVRRVPTKFSGFSPEISVNQC
jgi:hypothetical protein